MRPRCLHGRNLWLGLDEGTAKGCTDVTSNADAPVPVHVAVEIFALVDGLHLVHHDEIDPNRPAAVGIADGSKA